MDRKPELSKKEREAIQTARREALKTAMTKGTETIMTSKENKDSAKKSRKDARTLKKESWHNFFSYWQQIKPKKKQINELQGQINGIKKSIDEESDEVITISKAFQKRDFETVEEAKQAKDDGIEMLNATYTHYSQTFPLERELERQNYEYGVLKIKKSNAYRVWYNCKAIIRAVPDEIEYQNDVLKSTVFKMGITVLKYWLTKTATINTPKYKDPSIRYLDKVKKKTLIPIPQEKKH